MAAHKGRRARARNKAQRKLRKLAFQTLDPRQMMDAAAADALTARVPGVAIDIFALANDDASAGPLQIAGITQPGSGSLAIVDAPQGA